jgi:hypothetical protein
VEIKEKYVFNLTKLVGEKGYDGEFVVVLKNTFTIL